MDRYIKIVEWAQNRYTTIKNGQKWLASSVGGKPTKYSKIEDLAFRKYVAPLCAHEGRKS